MKFIKTINGTFINIDDIYKVNHEWDSDSNFYFSYFYLRNGEKYDIFDCPEEFELPNGVKCVFDADCHMILNSDILHMAFHTDLFIFDIFAHEDVIWSSFLYKMRAKMGRISTEDKN